MRRWLILGLTIWPLAYLAFFVVLFVRAWTENDDTIFAPWVIAIHVFAFCSTIALAVIYELHLFRHNPSVDEQARVLWATLFLLVGPPAMAVYWWRYMRVA